jgi:peptidoglycan/LPS O-acetylase OafA/YrhL
MVRSGYSELFYPPTIGFVVTASGLFIILLILMDRTRSAFVYHPFKALGESSLFMYIVHLVLIVGVFTPFLPEESPQIFLVGYLSLVTVMMVVAYGLRLLKDRRRDLPFLIRFLIGS